MNTAWGKSYKEMVLKELKKNCRRSDRDISKIIKVHPSTVGRIRNNLEEKGNILGYTVCSDYHKANYSLSLLCIKVRNTDELKSDDNTHYFEINQDSLQDEDIILIDAYESYGIYDYVLTIASKDQPSLRKYINVLKNRISDNLLDPIDVINISRIYKKNEITYNEITQ